MILFRLKNAELSNFKSIIRRINARRKLSDLEVIDNTIKNYFLQNFDENCSYLIRSNLQILANLCFCKTKI